MPGSAFILYCEVTTKLHHDLPLKRKILPYGISLIFGFSTITFVFFYKIAKCNNIAIAESIYRICR